MKANIGEKEGGDIYKFDSHWVERSSGEGSAGGGEVQVDIVRY